MAMRLHVSAQAGDWCRIAKAALAFRPGGPTTRIWLANVVSHRGKTRRAGQPAVHSGQRNLGRDVGPPSRRAVDVQAAVEGLDPGRESLQAGAVGGVGAADAVVGDGHRGAAVASG